MTNTTPTNNTPDLKTLYTQFESLLEEYLGKKAPALPTSAKEAIVKYSPYITLLVLLFALPAILAALGLSALFTPFAYMGGLRYGMSFSITTIILLVSLVLEGMAIPGLFARKASAWKLVYYATLVNGLYSLFSFNLGGFIIGTGIGLYVLIQIKSYYKN